MQLSIVPQGQQTSRQRLNAVTVKGSGARRRNDFSPEQFFF
jgi:hypothetical protein